MHGGSTDHASCRQGKKARSGSAHETGGRGHTRTHTQGRSLPRTGGLCPASQSPRVCTARTHDGDGQYSGNAPWLDCNRLQPATSIARRWGHTSLSQSVVTGSSPHSVYASCHNGTPRWHTTSRAKSRIQSANLYQHRQRSKYQKDGGPVSLSNTMATSPSRLRQTHGDVGE